MAARGHTGLARRYGSGPISSEAAEIYRLQWELSEIADFAQLLASAAEPGPDADIARQELHRYLVL